VQRPVNVAAAAAPIVALASAIKRLRVLRRLPDKHRLRLDSHLRVPWLCSTGLVWIRHRRRLRRLPVLLRGDLVAVGGIASSSARSSARRLSVRRAPFEQSH
jgi:hypothetical protein